MVDVPDNPIVHGVINVTDNSHSPYQIPLTLINKTRSEIPPLTLY